MNDDFRTVPGLSLNWLETRKGFIEYAQRYNPKTTKCLVAYLDRYVKTIQSPMDVMRLFNGLSNGQQHHLNRRLKALFNFAEIMGFDKRWLTGLRKAISKDPIGIDLRIPEESEVLSNFVSVSKISLKYQALWNLCLDSGLRLIEAIWIIQGFDSKNKASTDSTDAN